MGAEQPGLKQNPNCTAGSGDRTANKTTGSHDGRRIGIATSSSLDGEPPRHNVAGIWIASVQECRQCEYRWDRPLASAGRAAVRAGCLCLGQHRRQQPFAVSPATVSHLSTRSSDADRCCWQHHPQEWLGADDVQGPWEAGAAHGPRLRALCRWALHTKRHRPGAAEFTWRRSLGKLLTVSFELHPLSELLRAGLDR